MANAILSFSTLAAILAASSTALALDPPSSTSKQADGAASNTSETPAWEKAPTERRGGFSVGVLFGGAVGNIAGYPADLEKRGKAAFRTDMGAALGGSGTLWLGGALTDWLVFGVGGGGGSFTGNGVTLQGFTFIFHTEAFPLYWRGGVWRELGIAFDTGAGSFTGELSEKPQGAKVAPVIESGAASRVGFSLFYDGLRLWKVSAGPYVGFDYTWSATLSQPLVTLGIRTALYTKAKTK
ncbi:MAG: hypothetical protein IPK82_15880 [Polyangiaceae bacterium]|nr:hypothetical protein [Polyangiaceae bacterium]